MSKLVKISSLAPNLRAAAAAAIATSRNAYAPYSEFHVGAAFVHPDDSITVGCNYENCTFQATCAERCAMVSANAQGKRRAVAVAIYGASNKPGVAMPADVTCPPCGLCRQHLFEVADLSGCDLDLVLVAADRVRARVQKLSEFLPQPFGPTSFGVDLAKYRPPAAVAAVAMKNGAKAAARGGAAAPTAATKATKKAAAKKI